MAIVALRDDCGRWLASRGIDQWAPGEVALADVRDQVGRGEWFLVRDPAHDLLATVRFLWADELFWGPQPPVAGYVHGLAVARPAAGRGLGAAVLRWAEARALSAGRDLLRLDCAAHNAGLRAYYTRQGYAEVGVIDFDDPHRAAVLLERRVG